MVAALIHDDQRRVLIARRPAGKQHGGLWEFPGGKVDAGESARSALYRELKEELGIDIVDAARVMTTIEKRESIDLHLQAWRVLEFRGSPKPIEAAGMWWCEPDALPIDRMPPADLPIARCLQLPSRYFITPDASALSPQRLLELVRHALEKGIRLIRIRCAHPYQRLTTDLLNQCEGLISSLGGRLMVDLADRTVCKHLQTGVHLRSTELRRLRGRPTTADCLLIASCHTADDVQTALELGVDALTVSPVLPTTSHPGQPALGWTGFQRLQALSPMPVYALGGMKPEHLPDAQAHGAIGIAGIGAFV